MLPLAFCCRRKRARLWSRREVAPPSSEDSNGKYSRYQRFFQQLLDELREKYRFTNARVGQPQNWYSFSTGKRGLQYGISFAAGNRIHAELYIDVGDSTQNASVLDALLEKRTSLETEFGEPLEWEKMEGRRACRIAVYRSGSIEDAEASLEQYHR